jgi:hypothetical protein
MQPRSHLDSTEVDWAGTMEPVMLSGVKVDYSELDVKNLVGRFQSTFYSSRFPLSRNAPNDGNNERRH